MMERDISENILLCVYKYQVKIFQDLSKLKEESEEGTYCQSRKEEQDKCDLLRSFRMKTSS